MTSLCFDSGAKVCRFPAMNEVRETFSLVLTLFCMTTLPSSFLGNKILNRILLSTCPLAFTAPVRIFPWLCAALGGLLEGGLLFQPRLQIIKHFHWAGTSSLPEGVADCSDSSLGTPQAPEMATGSRAACPHVLCHTKDPRKVYYNISIKAVIACTGLAEAGETTKWSYLQKWKKRKA